MAMMGGITCTLTKMFVIAAGNAWEIEMGLRG
jgi:hypothetical protein